MVKRLTKDAATRRAPARLRASIKKSTIKRVEREGRAMRAMLGNAKDKEKKAARDQRAGDSFVNYALNLGMGTNNALAGSSYGFNPITRIRTLLDWVHRGSWLGGIAIDLVADDMTRGGIELLSTNKPEDQQTIHRTMTRLRVWSELNDSIKWARLYGGCLAVMLIDGQNPSTPLRIEAVGKGSFRGLMPLDRWMVDPDLQHLVSEFGPNLGLPETYRLVADAPAMRNQVIHYTRVIRLEGIRLPYWQRVMENLWGLSVIERLYDRMVAFDSATQGAAQLVYKSYLRTYSMDGLREAQTAGGDSMVGIAAMVEMMRKYQGIEGVTLIDSKDKFEAHSSTSFAGIGEALLQFGQQLSGALQIPLVRLFGQSPAGLNSTGESDLRTYYDGILQAQERDLRDGVGRVLRVCARSEGITLPDTFDFNFRPLWQLNEEQKSQVFDRDTRTFIETEAAGLVSERTALKELQQLSKVTGRWTNITPEMIEAASDIVQAPDPGVEGIIGEGGAEDPIKAGQKLAEGGEEAGDYVPPFAAAGHGSNGKGVQPEEGDEEYVPSFQAAGHEPRYRGPFASAGFDNDPDKTPPTNGAGRRVKDRRARDARDARAVSAIMNAALADPRVQRALLRPDIDREHDVVAGSVSNAAGGKTYVSSLLPREMTFGQVTIDPALPLNVHEQVERFCMFELGIPYARAHIVATAAEKWYVTARAKVSWPDWEHWIDGELSKIERGPDASKPPDPHVDPDVAVRDAAVEVIPDVLNAEGWFSVKVNGEVLRDKNAWARRFRSEASAAAAGRKYVKERGQSTDDGIRELVEHYVTPANARAAVIAALIGLVSHVGQAQGPEFDAAIEHTVANISDIAHISVGKAREIVQRATRNVIPAKMIARDVKFKDLAVGEKFKFDVANSQWRLHGSVEATKISSLKYRIATGEVLKINTNEWPVLRDARTGDAPFTEVAGQQVVVEYPKGSIKRWEGGQTVYPCDYGYVRRRGSAEGPQEWLDCLIGPHLGSREVWVVDSVNAVTGKFDEHKLIFGAKTAREALGYFRGIYPPSFRKIGAVTHLSVDSYEFKDWIARGDKARPMQELAA